MMRIAMYNEHVKQKYGLNAQKELVHRGQGDIPYSRNWQGGQCLLGQVGTRSPA